MHDKPNFTKETKKIFRLKVPFEKLYTSIFLIKSNGITVLIDCATDEYDVNEYLILALNEKKIKIENVDYLIISHNHVDHAGGLGAITKLNPKIKVITSVCNLPCDLEIISLKGHAKDCIGVYEPTSKTLITCDGLQGDGIDKYRCSISDKQEYIKTIKVIKENLQIENLLFSHAFEPWYKDGVFGRKDVENCLNDCINCIKKAQP